MVLCRLRLLRRPYSSPDPCSRKEKPTRRPVGRDWSAGELVAARPLPRGARSLPGLQGLGRHRRRQPDHSRSLLRRPRRRHHSPHFPQHHFGKLPPRRPRQHRNRHPRQARREAAPKAAARRAPHRRKAAGDGVLGFLTRAAGPSADRSVTLAWPAHNRRVSRLPSGWQRPAPGLPDRSAGSRRETIR